MDYTEKTEKIQSPAVAIDGTKARTIREAKKLTQLYVASVVGVTTDTISRWENNRYPSIKRDNAEKLALALEIDLADILKTDESTTPPELPPATNEPIAAVPPGYQRQWMMGGGLLLAIVATAILYLLLKAPGIPTAHRVLPAFAAPGAAIPIKIQLLRPDPGKRGFIVKEQLPEGWVLLKADPPTLLLGPKQELKWLIPAGMADTQILYLVQVPAGALLNSTADFSGKIILEGSGSTKTEAVGGRQRVNVAGKHWADQNGDNTIDDTEIMPAYYLSEEFRGFNLDWQEIETIWNNSGYRWDMKTRKLRPQP